MNGLSVVRLFMNGLSVVKTFALSLRRVPGFYAFLMAVMPLTVSGCARIISFEIRLISKEITRAEREYTPP